MSQGILTKRALAESLKTQMRQRSFGKITIDDICDAAGVSRRTFYHHFKDKYELLSWVYDYEFCQGVDEREDRTIWDYFPEVCEYLYEDRKFFLNAFTIEGQNSFRDFCSEKLYPLLMNDLGERFPNERVAKFILGKITDAVFDSFVWWFTECPDMSPEEYTEYVIQLCTEVSKGIATIRSHSKE